MRAAVQREYGPPSVVSVTEVAKPEPGDGELLVEVHTTTVNRTDCGFRAASPPIVRLFSGLRRPKRPTLGNEFAGVVVGSGSGVSRFAVGERIFGYIEGPFGGHAEYLTVHQDGRSPTSHRTSPTSWRRRARRARTTPSPTRRPDGSARGWTRWCTARRAPSARPPCNSRSTSDAP